MSHSDDATTQILKGSFTDPQRPDAQTGQLSAALAPGQIIGDRYLLEKELGRGGIGAVLLARDQKLHDAPVVIKILLESVKNSHHKEWYERHFQQETEALARIDHPAVVRILDKGTLSDGRIWFAMQYVAGTNLRSQIARQGMELPRAAAIIRQLGQALTAAHEQGIFHRDLKPENIMLQQTGGEEFVKVIDFGIATVNEKRAADAESMKTTQIAGTMAYMAPEQFEGKPVAASDIYALGVIAYEMVTGRHPFTCDTVFQLREMQREGVRVNPCDLRPALPLAAQTALLKALAFSKRDRFATAKEFGDTLADALSAEAPESPAARLELAHVLFIDFVAHSTLPINEQERLSQELQKIVSGTQEFMRAQSARQLLRLPTGDGLALIFFGDPVAPAQCAVEIAATVRQHPDLCLRMGIHTGPVRRIADINQNLNVSGGGIIIAQRVMDCGDTGHILVSKTVADVLSQLSEWQPALHDLGEYVVKHGERVHLFNLYTEDFGNPAPAAKNQPQPVAPIPQPEEQQKKKSLFSLAINGPISCQLQIVLMLFLSLVPIGLYTQMMSKSQPASAPTTQVHASPELSLTYWLTAQRNPRLFPGSKPFVLPGETVVGAGDRVRLHVTSPQAGFLYLINEGPQPKNGLPQYNVLFPYALTSAASAVISAGQTIQIPQPSRNPAQDWFVLDGDEGAEQIWIVWATRAVPELEAVKAHANPKTQGQILDAAQITAVQGFLATQSAMAPHSEKDEAKQQTRLTGFGEVLVKMVKLEHR